MRHAPSPTNPTGRIDVELILEAFTDWDAAARRLGDPDADVDAVLLAGRHPDQSIRCRAAERGRAMPRVMVQAAADAAFSVRKVAAANPGTPTDTLRSLVHDRSTIVLRALAANQATPADVLAELAGHTDRDVRRSVAESKARLPERSLQVLAEDAAVTVRQAVAARAHLPEPLVRRLAADASTPVRAAIAAHAHLPADVAADLATRPDYTVQTRLVRNRSIGPTVHELLARSPFDHVRAAIATSRLLGREALEALATDDYVYIRRGIARRNDVPHLLAVLARDPELEVRLAVASNPAATGTALDILASSASLRLRRQVVDNPRVRESTLERLLADADPQVRADARRHLATRRGCSGPDEIDPPTGEVPTWDDGLRRIFSWLDRSHRVDDLVRLALAPKVRLEVRTQLLAHPDASAAMLAEAAAHADHRIRRIVAGLAHCPDDVLYGLAGDRAVSVRSEVLRRREIPERVAHRMRLDRDPQLRSWAMARYRRIRRANDEAAARRATTEHERKGA